MKTTKLLPLMAAAVGASIALAPSDAKALTVSFNLQGSPVGNNSINAPAHTVLNVGAGTTITAATPPAALAPLQAAIAGFAGTFTTNTNIFGAAPTSISFTPTYTTPGGATVTFATATTTNLTIGTAPNNSNAATQVLGWAFTIAGGGVPLGSTGVIDLLFINQGAGSSFSWTGTGSLNIPSSGVPGPLPLLGAGAAFGWSRRLRKRLSTGTSQA